MRNDPAIEPELVLDAVLHNIEVIGEAAGRLSEGIKERTSEIPWKKIKGMRNIVAHEYFSVDADVVWRTVDEHLNPLLEVIETLLAEMDDSKDE